MVKMKNNISPKKLEIFLWLALRQAARQETEPKKEVEAIDSAEADKISENSDSAADELPLLFGQLNKSDTDKLKTLLADYNNKAAAEKENWKKRIHSFVGTDYSFLDENLHWSHLEEPLKKEPLAVRKIIFKALPEADKNHLKDKIDIKINQSAEIKERKSKAGLIEQSVQRAFAKQFTSLHDLQKPTAFDRLNGTQTVRLIRLAGIREVTFACARIEAVETIAAFLKRFPAEAARAIATQLNNLPKTSEERLLFAENLVQNALETEPQPSAMLDLLGVWLVGIRVCESPQKRISYAQQKLPKEFAPELSEIIETQCRKTSPQLQKVVSAEIEQLAETILKTTKGDSKSSKD